MGTDNWEEVEEILDQALKLPEDDQLSYVHEVCKAKPNLKMEVELMLLCIKNSEGWMED